jgi:RimJ/RimL family protein N-acetyltransferase
MSLPETIRTERLALRPFRSTDGPAVLAYSRDPDWVKFQQTIPVSERDAERVVAQMQQRDFETEPTWAITRDGQVLGLVGLTFSAGHQIATLGYGIHHDHRGFGFTTEAVRAVLDAAFDAYGQLTRVSANTDASNHKSIRLLEKLAFSLEGTLRSGGVTAAGELVDGAIYAVLRPEWFRATA